MMLTEFEQAEYEYAIRKEGELNKAISTAKNLLANHIDAEMIAKCTGLSIDQVLSLQKEMLCFA